MKNNMEKKDKKCIYVQKVKIYIKERVNEKVWSNTWKSFKFERAGDSDGWVIYNCTRISP